MRKIQDLISQLCPNGVEFKQLQEIFELERGCPPPSNNRGVNERGVLPWFQLSDIRRNGAVLVESAELVAVEDTKQIQQFPANTIIISIFAKTIKHALIKVPYATGPSFVTLLLKSDYTKQLDLRFVNYYCFVLDKLCVAKRNESLANSLNFSKFKRLKFPIPPLPVQKEIVAFLDNFTNLETELEAELMARRQQFVFYINRFFSFDKPSGRASNDSVSWQTLGEVGKFASGNGEVNGNYADHGIGFVHREHIVREFDVIATQAKAFISESVAKNFNKAKKGDLIIANKSMVDDEVCKAVVWLGDQDVVVGKDTYIYRHTLDPKFVAYYFKSKQFLKQKRSYSNGMFHVWISDSNLCDIKIPVLPKEEQQRIAALLDGFVLLLNDKSGGLPAELESRRKQHKFYRNKILSFKEAI